MNKIENVFFFSDKVFELPENWPKLPSIFRRKSCELTTASSPCVNKVISHLELLQDVVEDWFKDKSVAKISRENTDGKSRAYVSSQKL